MPHADRRTDVSPCPAAVSQAGPAATARNRSRYRATGADPAGSSQPEWTAILFTHDPACPAADAIDWWAARNITEHPGQGRTLLCNGALVFDDYGALLPDGRVTAILDVPRTRLCALA
jgi:hypothetical protein